MVVVVPLVGKMGEEMVWDASIVPVDPPVEEPMIARNKYFLESVRIENFKSYRGVFDLGPFPRDNPLICVVGPNGSGKSNLMDAVAFCFNCADSKKLRGDGIAANLITDCSDRPLNASVAVTLVDAANQTVVFSRTVTSKNDSKYSINGRKVTLENYRETMKECGLDSKGNFLVFQGDVEALALSDPASLGRTMDRISGSAELGSSFEDLKARKSHQEKEYSVLAARKKKLVHERKLIKAELAEIEKIDNLLSRKSKLVNEFFLNKLFLIDLQKTENQETVAATRSVEEIGKEMKAHESQLEKAKSARAKAEMKQSKLARKITTVELELRSLRERSGTAQLKLATCERRVETTEKRKSEKHSQSEQVKAKLIAVETQLSEKISALRMEEEKLEEILTRGVVDLDAQTDNLLVFPLFNEQTDREQLKRHLAKFRQVDVPQLTEELVAQLGSIDSALGRFNQSLSALKTRKSEVMGQLVKNEASERVIAEKLSELEKIVESRSSQLNQMKKELAASKTARLLGRQKRLESEKRTLLDELSDMKESEAEITRERELKTAVHELTLRMGREKVFGRFVDLVTPVDDSLSAAVQTAAGRFLDSVLVRDVATAKEAVNWLKSERRGISLTLIPVADVVIHPRRSIDESVARHAIDCVKLSAEATNHIAEIQRGVEYVLSGTIVCETITHARSVAYSSTGAGLSVVTVNGEKINSNGTITLSGETGKSSRFGLRQVNEVTAKLEIIDKELALVTTDLKTEQIEVEKISSAIRAKELEIAYDCVRRDQLRAEFQRMSDSIAAIGKFVSENDQEMEKVGNEIERIEKLRDSKRMEVRVIVRRAAREFLISNFGITVDQEEVLLAVGGSVNDPSVCAKAQLEQTKQQQREMVNRAESAVAALDSEKRCLELELGEINDCFKQLEIEISSARKNLSTAQREAETASAEVGKTTESIQSFRAELEASKSGKSEHEESIKTLVQKIQTLRAEQIAAKTEAIKAQKASERIKNSKVQVLKDAVMQNAFIPLSLDAEDLTMGSLEEVSRRIIESVFVSLSAVVPFNSQSPDEGDDSMESLIDEVLSKLDLSGVAADVKRRGTLAASKNRTSLLIAEIEREFASAKKTLEEELEQAGAGISRSTRNGESSKSALEAIETELSSIALNAEKVKQTMAEISQQLGTTIEERNKRFLACFNFVSQKVDELYKILTSYDDGRADHNFALATTSTASATLELEVPVVAGADLRSIEAFNSGVLFSLMPPFKRYTNIELLSGGEKTVAAVALLFAFLAFSAPPICMVDEIDAALDAENVAVLSRFMKRAVSHQLIVISLKENLYAKADCLIGVFKDAKSQGSGIVTLDLRPYPEEDPGEEVPRTGLKGDGPQMTPAPVTERRENRVLLGGA